MKKWEKIASDYYAPFYRNYLWVRSFIVQPKLLGTKQVSMGIKSFQKIMGYFLIEPETWRKTYQILSDLIDKDIGVLEKILKKTVEIGKMMNDFTERFIKDDLTKYSNKKIISAYKKYEEYNILEYAWGTLIPLLDFQNYHYIEDKVSSILNLKLDKNEAVKAFIIFTQPLKDSFVLEQEKSIFNIYQKISNKQIFKKEPEEIINKLKSDSPKIYQKFKKHIKKYAWIYYVYAGPVLIEKDFIETMIFYFQKKINPVKKLKELKNDREHILNERKKYFNKLDLTNKEKKYIEIISKLIHLKPRRKDYQSKSYYHLEFLQKEIGKRLNLSLNQVRSATLEEIRDVLLYKKIIDIDKLNQRIKLYVITPDNKKVKVYSGRKAEEFSKENIKEEKINLRKVNRIEANMAYPGYVKGVVKRVDIPEDMEKMKEGDILVSTATTPSIIPAIRKAAAIITDEGGITCHAAIISREFKIPCIVGTKISTKVLKDGDLVEVDANKGVVKILKIKIR